MKKVFPKLLFVLLLFCVISALTFSCAEKAEPTSALPAEDQSAATEKTSILFLGDSIGEAVAGPTPLTEREAYGYYGIIGNINDFDYHNRAVSGYTSGNLMNYIRQEDDGIHMLRSLISAANVIHISILGNDFLYHYGNMLIEVAKGNLEELNRRKASATEHLHQTITYLRELNPNAVILLQTLYNPTAEDSALISKSARARLSSEARIDKEGYHELMGNVVHVINSVLTEYLEAHTTERGAPYELIDVYSRFEEVYRSDRPRWNRFFCEDGIHPQNEGHALIAELLQDKLKELGFASPNALQRYKEEKAAQLDRLYPELANKEQVRADIFSASDFAAVTAAYFENVKDKTPALTALTARSGKTFDKTRVFSLTSAKVTLSLPMFSTGSEGIDLFPFFDPDQCRISFGQDGSYELTVTLKDLWTSVARGYLEERSPLDLGAFGLDTLLLYVHNIAPDIESTDLEGLFRALEVRYGILIEGIDFTDPALRAALLSFRETGRLVVTEDCLSERIAVTCRGTYSLEEVVSPATGETFTAIYVNNPFGEGESYVRYTYTTDEDMGWEYVRMRIDVLSFALEGKYYDAD